MLGKVGGCSLRAGVAVKSREPHDLERLCRDIARPAVLGVPVSLRPTSWFSGFPDIGRIAANGAAPTVVQSAR